MNWVIPILTVAPSIIQAVESIFAKKPKTGPQKATVALQLIQTALISALSIDPKLFGDAEKTLIQTINNAVVAYYNEKGWPTQ